MNVFSVVLLICSISSGQCVTMAPKVVLHNKDLCDQAAQVVQDKATQTINNKDAVVTGRCISWGESS